MEENVVNSGDVVEALATPQPAPGAEEQKPNAEPASVADDQKPEQETDEQKARRESRRSRQNARRAAELAEAKTEARMLRERLEKLETQSPASTEPKRDDFESLEDYHRALARHEAKVETQKAIEADRKARTEAESRSRTEAAQQRIQKQWGEREAAFEKTAKDYREAVGAFMEGEMHDLSFEARRAILESDVGPNLFYHLAKNPDEAERIAELSPLAQVRELGKLEAKIVQPKKTTSAPEPASGVKGKSSASGYRSDFTQAEFEKWAKSNGSRRIG